MIKPKEHFHGSDLEKIEQIYGIKKEDITSFSANVNPLGISPNLRSKLSAQIDAITSYPDREYTSLRQCMADYTHANIEDITVGNGSTELISLFIQLINPKHALLLSPTYSEYQREISLNGGVTFEYELKERNDFKLELSHLFDTLSSYQLASTPIDMLIICNPNNPTSTAISVVEMESILKECKKNNITVMVDETYVEFTPDITVVSAVPLTKTYDNLIILRGISKFFAAPGLRLGYAICGNQSLLQSLNSKKNPWSINTLASIAGEIMFTDSAYIKASLDHCNKERERIIAKLSSCSNIKVYKPYANFILLKILKEGVTSSMIFDKAISKGFMIRDCSNFTYLDNTFIRFCFMESEKNSALMDLILDELK